MNLFTLRFKTDHKLVDAVSQIVEKQLMDCPQLLYACNNVHEQIQQMVITNLMNTRTGDPTKTDILHLQSGEHASAISLIPNIKSYVYRKGNSIFGGTGEIWLMDANDPLNKIRAIKSPTHKLWRILEKGVQGPFAIPPSNRDSLSFYWKKMGRWSMGPVTKHPGQIGRFYFANAQYTGNELFTLNVRAALNNIFNYYSYH